jgi:hypothetical protein
MKRYPKIPRHNHPVIENFFEDGQAYVTEKYDGTNFRFTLYEERFQEYYTHPKFKDSVTELDPETGDLIFGLKGTLRGTSQTDIEELDGNLNRIVNYLKSEVDKSQVKKLQSKFGPLIFFCEGMVYHTLDYGYLENPPPPIIGFDVYSFKDDSREEITPKPYEETFEGFFETPTAMSLFEQINVPQASPSEDVEVMDLESFDPETYQVPESKLGDVKAEGVVFRKVDSFERAKYVSPKFREMNNKSWGYTEKEAETGEELFVAIFCPPARIRKMVMKLVNEEGYEFSRSIIEEVYPRVFDDIWEEEWREIKELDFEFNPSEVKPLIAEQCAETVKRMEVNSKLNEADVDTLWEDIV